MPSSCLILWCNRLLSSPFVRSVILSRSMLLPDLFSLSLSWNRTRLWQYVTLNILMFSSSRNQHFIFWTWPLSSFYLFAVTTFSLRSFITRGGNNQARFGSTLYTKQRKNEMLQWSVQKGDLTSTERGFKNFHQYLVLESLVVPHANWLRCLGTKKLHISAHRSFCSPPDSFQWKTNLTVTWESYRNYSEV